MRVDVAVVQRPHRGVEKDLPDRGARVVKDAPDNAVVSLVKEGDGQRREPPFQKCTLTVVAPRCDKGHTVPTP